jgi:hypothetical protein
MEAFTDNLLYVVGRGMRWAVTAFILSFGVGVLLKIDSPEILILVLSYIKSAVYHTFVMAVQPIVNFFDRPFGFQLGLRIGLTVGMILAVSFVALYKSFADKQYAAKMEDSVAKQKLSHQKATRKANIRLINRHIKEFTTYIADQKQLVKETQEKIDQNKAYLGWANVQPRNNLPVFAGQWETLQENRRMRADPDRYIAEKRALNDAERRKLEFLQNEITKAEAAMEAWEVMLESF